MFVAGASPEARGGDLTNSRLGERHLARYHRERIASADSCETALGTWGGAELSLWLTRDPRGRRVLVVVPVVPHVVANCSVPLVLPAAEVRALLADPALRRKFVGNGAGEVDARPGSPAPPTS